MEERGSGPIEDRLDVAFHVLLMVSANPRQTPALALIVTISNPFFSSEGMVVRRIVLGFDAIITQKCFKGVFGLEGFRRCQICLMAMENQICCPVNEYSSSNELTRLVFIAQRMSQLAKGGGHVLVTRDAIARPEVASSEETFPKGGVWMLWVDGGDSFLFGILACFTFWRLTAGRAMGNWNYNASVKVSFSL